MFTSSPSEHTASNRKRRRKRRRKNKMIVRIPSRLHQTMGPVFDIATQSHVTEEYGLVSLFEHLGDNHDNPRERERERERWR